MDRLVQTSQQSCWLHFGIRGVFNARDLSLRDICGSDALNCLFEGATRVFYEDTLCVDPRYRRQHIAQKLSFALIDALRDEGFAYLTGRTSIAAEAMSALF
jgi:GNAT superfamily N-acetyltransferase